VSAVEKTPAWYQEAACRESGPAVFYTSQPGPNLDTQTAKQVCRSCVVREDCLWDAIDRQEPFGIWGGLTVRQRERFIRKRLAVHSSETFRRYGRHPR